MSELRTSVKGASRLAVSPEELSPYAALQRLDWDFRSRVKASALENIHPYPAKFIPELPGALLDHLRVPEGMPVLDPFVGSGTTLVECQRRGISSIGIDLNPIACLISRVKTAPLPLGIRESIEYVLDRATEAGSAVVPDIPNVDHWFGAPAKLALASLTEAISKVHLSHRDILRLALSSIIVRVSRQDSDTRYAAVEKVVSFESVITTFEQAGTKLVAALEQRAYDLAPAEIIEGDTLAVLSTKLPQVGAVITSPPYPNAYEYWLYHKYRMWWLGHDPVAVKRQEIGARAHFFKANGHTADDFVRQMSRTFRVIKDVLHPDGYAAFVIGRSKIHGEMVDNAAIIAGAGAALGFKVVLQRDRNIAASRKSFNLSHANIKTETILVLKRTQQ